MYIKIETQNFSKTYTEMDLRSPQHQRRCPSDTSQMAESR